MTETKWKGLYFDIAEADCLEKYLPAREALLAAITETEETFRENPAAGIRAYCRAMRTFFDSVFGEGTSNTVVFKDMTDNIRTYTQIYSDFERFRAAQESAVQNPVSEYTPTRKKRKK